MLLIPALTSLSLKDINDIGKKGGSDDGVGDERDDSSILADDNDGADLAADFGCAPSLFIASEMMNKATNRMAAALQKSILVPTETKRKLSRAKRSDINELHEFATKILKNSKRRELNDGVGLHILGLLADLLSPENNDNEDEFFFDAFEVLEPKVQQKLIAEQQRLIAEQEKIIRDKQTKDSLMHWLLLFEGISGSGPFYKQLYQNTMQVFNKVFEDRLSDFVEESDLSLQTLKILYFLFNSDKEQSTKENLQRKKIIDDAHRFLRIAWDLGHEFPDTIGKAINFELKKTHIPNSDLDDFYYEQAIAYIGQSDSETEFSIPSVEIQKEYITNFYPNQFKDIDQKKNQTFNSDIKLPGDLYKRVINSHKTTRKLFLISKSDGNGGTDENRAQIPNNNVFVSKEFIYASCDYVEPAKQNEFFCVYVCDAGLPILPVAGPTGSTNDQKKIETVLLPPGVVLHYLNTAPSVDISSPSTHGSTKEKSTTFSCTVQVYLVKHPKVYDYKVESKASESSAQKSLYNEFETDGLRCYERLCDEP
jgi:hypothetical protein